VIPCSSTGAGPGAGFTHSLAFGLVVGGVVYLCTRSRPWAFGLTIGLWLHTLSDLGDTVGVMLFFPLTTHVYSLGMWANAHASARVSDAAAYYSGLGFVWDAMWIAAVLACWPVLRASYFRERVAPRDGFWAWSGRLLPEDALLALYRGAVFFGICRFAGWMIWAHVLHDYSFDISWGGPHWADAAQLP